MRVLIVVLLVFTSLSGLSQRHFTPGYIIKENGDTIIGFIKNEGNKSNNQKCFFKEKKSQKLIEYSANDLISYRLSNNRYFVSKSISLKNQPKKVFLEYLVNGKVDLFYSKDKYGTHFYLQTDNDSLMELKNSEIELTLNNQLYIKDKKEYIGILKVAYSDCPEISTQIEKLKFNHIDLIKVTKDYHNRVCSEYECVTYNKNTKLDYSIGYFLGVSSNNIQFKIKGYEYDFMEDEEFKITTSISTGLLVSVNNLFGASEKLSSNFQIGYRGNKYSSENIEILKQNLYIPIYFTYNFLYGKWSPILNFGFSNTISLKKTIDATKELNKIILEYAVGNYQIFALAGIGIEYKGKKVCYCLYSNSEIGSGIIKMNDYHNNFLSSWTFVSNINFGIKYNL